MATFPITYMAIIIWLILITYQDDNYWTRFVAKLMGVWFGMWTSINTFNGEQWLFVSSTGSYTLTQVKDGFQLPLALLVLAISIILMFMLAYSYIEQDWKKDMKSDEN